jgi:magnesium-transporting ATPase (P-type)
VLLTLVLLCACVCPGVVVQMVKNTDLVVGDVYLVNMGDKVVADGIMLDGFHLVIDEASLTGDAQLVKSLGASTVQPVAGSSGCESGPAHALHGPAYAQHVCSACTHCAGAVVCRSSCCFLCCCR